MDRKSVIKTALLVVFGLFFIVPACVIFKDFPALFVSVLNKNLAISPSAPGYPHWLEPPLPVFTNIYLFNILNPEDVLSKHSKPILQQLGPYVYREKRKKILVTFNNDNDTVSYMVQKWYEHEPDLSVGSIDDVITIINLPALGAAYTTRYEGWMTQFGVNSALTANKETVFITTTVNEILFEGAESGILKFAKSMPFVDAAAITSDRFGLFHGKNMSTDGRWAVHTGKDDITKVGQVDMWNNVKQVSCWPRDCGSVRGSNGEQYSPSRNKYDPITFHAADLFRALSLEFDSEVDIHGLPANRYTSTPNLFANGSFNPENECFDPPGGIATGVVNMSTCLLGAPIFLSLPHYLYADESYVEGVEGLDPNKEEHTIKFDVNPTLGFPVKVEAKLQLSALLSPIKGIRLYEKVPTVFIPLMWVEQEADVTGPMETGIKLIIHVIPMLIGVILPMIFIFLSVILLIAAVCVYRNGSRKSISGNDGKPNYSQVKMAPI